jgi:hypothetical protein
MMDSTPIPTARPNFARQDQATGLTLLSLALKLEHITRVTESLNLINTDHLSRSVYLDIDLRELTVQQRRALEVHEQPGIGDQITNSTGSTGGSRLWVPISRHSREDLAPVVVRDGSGRVVPRLTQSAVTSAVIAGVAWLFRTYIPSAVRTGLRQEPFDHGWKHPMPSAGYGEDRRARWLIEAAAARLIEHGSHGTTTDGSRPQPSDSTERTLAERYLLNLDDRRARHLNELLTLASREYFLVVMLTAENSHQFLTYDAPLIPAVRSLTARRRAWKAMLPVSTEFSVSYVTQLPRAVGSYHVTIDVPEEIDVRRFILSTDADQPSVEDLARRIHAVLKVMDSQNPAFDRLIRIELEEIESCLGLLGQRRRLDLQGFEYYLQNRELPRPQNLGSSPKLVEQLASLQRTQSDRGAPVQESGPKAASENQSMAQLRREDLAYLADLSHLIRLRDLGYDVSTDNDPRENGAHAQWRPVPLAFGYPTVEPVEAKVYLAMADEPPALVGSVAKMIGALLVVVVGLYLIAQLSNATKFSQADAVVAVLLIVPGILLARLDIPSTHSVLGRLRKFPRGVAFASVAFTTGLAMAVAVQSTGRTAAFIWCALLLFVLLLLCFVEIFGRSKRRKVLVPSSDAIPSWLRDHFGESRPPGVKAQTHPPDEYFDAIRPVPNSTKVASPEYEDEAARWGRRSGKAATNATEGPALLAEIGARAVAGDYVETWVEIAHGTDPLPNPPARALDEFLFTSLGGLAQQVSSGFVETGETGPNRPLSPGRRGSPLVSGEGESDQQWMATFPLESGTIRQNVDDIDLLVEFPRASHVAMSKNMLTFLHGALSVRFAPGVAPTLVLAPAATGASSSGSDPFSSRAAGAAMRLTFTLPHADHENRLALELAMLTLARQQKVRLWLASRRPGAGQGDWRCLRPAAFPSAEELAGARSLIPITFVAKASARSVQALRAFRGLTRALLEAEANVTLLIASLLGQHAVVQLAVGTSVEVTSCLHVGQKVGVAAVFEHLEEMGGLMAQAPDREVLSAIGFDAYVGRGQGSMADRMTTAYERLALWVDWELPLHAVGDREIAYFVVAKCREHIGWTEILYWRTDRVGHDKVRGRAKLAVDVAGAATGQLDAKQLGEKVKRVQSETLARLRRVVDPVLDHAIFLHVVWSEPWLTRRRA